VVDVIDYAALPRRRLPARVVAPHGMVRRIERRPFCGDSRERGPSLHHLSPKPFDKSIESTMSPLGPRIVPIPHQSPNACRAMRRGHEASPQLFTFNHGPSKVFH
jgi:hypothetical protein